MLPVALALAPLALFQGQASGPIARWTLDDAVAAFLRGNPDLAEARFRVDEARADRVTAELRPNPEIQGGLSNILLRSNPPPTGNGPGLQNNLVFNAGVSQTFELGGKRRKRIAVAEGGTAAAAADEGDVLRNKLFELRSAFYRVLLASSHQRLNQEELDGYAQTIRITRVQVEAGQLAVGAEAKIELEGMKYQVAVEQSRSELLAAKADLLLLVGPGAPEDVEVVGELAPTMEERGGLDPDQVPGRIAARPDVVAARRRLEAAQARLALAQAQAVPDVTLGLGYTHSQATGSGDNPDAVGTSVSVPLPVFNRNQGEIARARAAIAAAQHALDTVERAARLEAATRLHKVALARAVVDRFEGGFLQQAEAVRRTVEKAYRSGGASLLEFLEAVRTNIDTRSDYLDALYQLRASLIDLERAVGGDTRTRRTS